MDLGKGNAIGLLCGLSVFCFSVIVCPSLLSDDVEGKLATLGN